MAGETEATTSLAAKSSAELLKEWREHGHVHETYTATTGMSWVWSAISNAQNQAPFGCGTTRTD